MSALIFSRSLILSRLVFFHDDCWPLVTAATTSSRVTNNTVTGIRSMAAVTCSTGRRECDHGMHLYTTLCSWLKLLFIAADEAADFLKVTCTLAVFTQRTDVGVQEVPNTKKKRLNARQRPTCVVCSGEEAKGRKKYVERNVNKLNVRRKTYLN